MRLFSDQKNLLEINYENADAVTTQSYSGLCLSIFIFVKYGKVW